MKDEAPQIRSTDSGEFIIYNTDDGRTEVQLRLVENTVWMTQAEMSELFDISRSGVSEHLKSIFNAGELNRDEVVRKFRKEPGHAGQGRTLEHYNLDTIMAVGFRVRGPRGAQFRSWATSVLKEYLLKGFALNDEKLKDPLGADYFDDLLARIRDIRSSEARLYLELRNIIALADDYDAKSQRTHNLYATIQDKLHYAITGNTAAEIIATRCDPSADNLGLTSWKGNVVRKGDVTTAKNYLTNNELQRLNFLVSGFLNYAEDQALRRKVVHMRDWITKADQFIAFNEYEPLTGRGRITRKQADALAHERYDLFNQGRKQIEHKQADMDLVEALREADRKLVAHRKRLQSHPKSEP